MGFVWFLLLGLALGLVALAFDREDRRHPLATVVLSMTAALIGGWVANVFLSPVPYDYGAVEPLNTAGFLGAAVSSIAMLIAEPALLRRDALARRRG